MMTRFCDYKFHQDLMKKMRILEKAGKQQLGKEISRHKFVKRELINAEAEIEHLKAVIEVSWLYR